MAAYPITPASDVLEWMAGGLEQLGGQLLQAEDELAAINMTIGYLVLSLVLLAVNVWMGTAYLLVGTLWLLLVYGLWMFSRLLTRAD